QPFSSSPSSAIRESASKTRRNFAKLFWNCRRSGEQDLFPQILKRPIQDRVLPPIAVVEVPPLGFKDFEAFGLHGAAQERAAPSLTAWAAEVVGVGAVGKLVVAGNHLDGFACFEVKQRQIHGAAAIVARPL